ncbi:MAG TPA: aminotransferase class IV, partial [Verrucomicrobium sp.]|nr:aminotransferase class IV [Verrucomicrobium sp.]
MKPVAESYFWIQGGLVPEHEAKLSPLDQGFNVGDGVYETLRAYKGKPFSLIRHWNRLEKSCKKIYVQSPTYSAFKMMIEQTLEANQLEDARVRVTVSSGAGPFGSARSSREPTVVCAVSPAPQYDATARVVVVPWTRNEGGALAGIKTLSHGENVMGLQHARQRGASEAVFANTRGDLCEGATSNIFAVHGGRLTTPTLGSGCLPGVTRELVLEL